MSYVALYRKWRPENFRNLVGQEHISRTLSNALTSGKIAHAYLFSGPRGTGKTSTAKILAKALNCQHGPTPEPCNQCNNCTKINVGSSMDVFEIDAASNRGIDEIRDLRETVKFTPVDGRYKVYIIDEVHMLTTEAFNALLKTLEEPPAHVVFILATTEAHKVPATIHSRCQRYDFKRICAQEIRSRLELVAREMQIDAAEDALQLISLHADGGLRDALSILDQCSTLSGVRITADQVRQLLGLVGHEWIEKIVDALAVKDTKALLDILDELIMDGKDIQQILSEIALHMRSVMVRKSTDSAEGLDLHSGQQLVLERHAARFTHPQIVAIIEKMHAAMNEAKWSPQPRITAEVALLSFCRVPIAQPMDESLLKRIEHLEQRLSELTVAPAMAHQVLRESAHVTAQGNMPSPRPASFTGKVVSSQGEKVSSQPESVSAAHLPKIAVSGNEKEIWDRLLKELVKSGKRSVYACVSQGRLQSLTENQMTIAFIAAFPKERTEKSDYKAILETMLKDLCQSSIAVHCILESAMPPPKSSRVKKIAEVVPPKSLTSEEQHVVDVAVKMFGDNFVNKEDVKK